MASVVEDELRAVVLATTDSLDDLRAAHELLKKNHTRLIEQLDATTARLQAAEMDKERSLSECRALYANWNEQLKAQADEFKSIESQMIPQHELQLVKLQVRDELKASHLEAMQTVQTELERLREINIRERKKTQTLKAQLDQEISLNKQITESYKDKLDHASKNLLQTATNVSRSEEKNSELVKQLRESQKVSLELQLINSQLKQEVDEIRVQYDEQVLQGTRLGLAHVNALKEVEAQICVLKVQVEGADQRCGALHSGKVLADGRIKIAEQDLMKSRSQVADLHREMDSVRKQCQIELDAQAEHFQQQIVQADRARTSLENEIESYQSRLEAAEHAEMVNADDRSKREIQLEQKYQAQLDALDGQLRNSIQQLKSAQDDSDARSRVFSEKEAVFIQEIDQLKIDLESVTSSNTLHSEEVQSLQAALSVKRQEISNLSAEIQSNVQKVDSLQRDLDTAVQRRDSSVENAEQAQELVQRLQNKLDVMESDQSRDLADWIADRATLVTRAESAERKTVATLAQSDRLQSECASQQARIEVTLANLKKDRARYKAANQALRDRLVSVTRALTNAKDSSQTASRDGLFDSRNSNSLKSYIEREVQAENRIQSLLLRLHSPSPVTKDEFSGPNSATGIDIDKELKV